ncbi:MAG: sigma-70 family RNA polymerase sigma factor [Ruminococcus sp.]|nr:sigma-70 family RNA polymerase sigma factor [Ruminococcus sp.]
MEKTEITALAERAKSGDKDAFLQLYKEFHGRVSFFIRRLTNYPQAAADLTSDTFAAAMERISELRSGESFSGWLYSIAYNKCMQYINEKKRNVTLGSEAELEELLESAALNEPLLLPDDYAINAETRSQLQSIIDGLSPDQRSAVIMYYYDEMSVSEVAEAMGTNENNVSQKLHRARKKIRAQIEKLIGKGAMFGAVPMRALLGELDTSAVGIAAAGAAAIAVGIPYGLSKASGGTARELLWITRKYWAKHKKSLAALLFSGVLLCAVVVGTLLQIRADFNRSLHDTYDRNGMYDVLLTDVPDTITDELISKNASAEMQTVSVLAHKGSLYGYAVTCGFADGDISLMHLPFESGGLPQKANEAAVTRDTLNMIGWSGRTGDTVNLNGESYIVSGIIDKAYDDRTLTDKYFRTNAEEGADHSPLPSVYVTGQDNAEAGYKVNMFSGVAEGKGENISYFGMDSGSFLGYFGNSIGEDAWQHIYVNDIEGTAEGISQSDSFLQKVRWFLLIALIAAVIAVLSVFSVLRLIFAERRNTYEMLHRIGVSDSRLHVMYAIECLCLIIIQVTVGAALGIAGYFAMHTFEVKALEYTDYSAFTGDSLVTGNTAGPFIPAIAISAAVMLIGYISVLLFGRENSFGIRHRRPHRTVFGSIGAILGSRTVTVIQTVSLSLIVFGSMLGYMYFTDSDKENMNMLTYEPPESFAVNNQIDMERDGIAEYYSCQRPSTMGVQSLGGYGLMFADANNTNGLDDSTVSSFGSVTAYGTADNTFLIKDSEDTNGLGGLITYETELANEKDNKEFIRHYSKEQYKNFFDKGQLGSKYLYSIDTKLVNEEYLASLKDYVYAGELDIEAIQSGKEVAVIMSLPDDSLLPVGSTVNIGSLLINSESGYGIGDVSTAQTKIGAIIVVRPADLIKLGGLAGYITQSDMGYSLITTQTGAAALGVHNAIYSEVFSDHHIDGGLVPTNAGLELRSLEDIRSRRFIEKAASFGSFGFLALIMAALGFAAYFNGIGLKVRLKEYQLSVLRAIGASKRQIRRRLFINNIKIPLIATAAASGALLGVQKFMLSMYDKMLTIEPVAETANVFDEAYAAASDAALAEQRSMIKTYFLNSEMWRVSIAKPIILIFTVMTAVTVILMLMNMKRFDKDIAASMNRGRKRR